MTTVSVTFYGENEVPRNRQRSTADEIAKIGVKEDNRHLIDIETEYCELCDSSQCEYIDSALNSYQDAFE